MLRTVLASWAVLMGVAPMLAFGQEAREGESRALIVRLKPSAREGQLLSGTEQNVRRQRLSTLAASAGYTPTMRWRSMGGRLAVMKTPSSLKPEAARRLAARMMATGEVEWAEPSVKQKLLSYTYTPPDDVWYITYANDVGQWWARNVSGDNTSAKSLRQRGAPNISAAWQTTTVGRNQASGTVVAVLDTGILPHPDLDSAQVLPGYDFVSDTQFDRDGTPGRDNNPTDPGDWVDPSQASQPAFKALKCDSGPSSWHGLAVSGIVAAKANNTDGMAGANWATRLLPIRVSGMCGADLEDIIDGMRWAAGLSTEGGVTNANPAKVINISFGSESACGPAYQSVINELRSHGVVVVAAAGNEHTGVARPANCAGVVAVAALNREGFKTTYSNFGPEVTVSTVGGDPGPSWPGSTDHGAWGAQLQDGGIFTLYNSGVTAADAGGDYRYYAGTSFSSPIVAGVVALMLDANPALTPQQIIDGLKASARPHVQSNQIGACSSSNPGRCICTETTCGKGILDAGEAVRYAAALAAATPYTPLTLVGANIDTTQVAAALAVAPADRGPNSGTSGAVQSSGKGGGGGGGAIGVHGLLALGALVTAMAAGRRRVAGRRPSVA